MAGKSSIYIVRSGPFGTRELTRDPLNNRPLWFIALVAAKAKHASRNGRGYSLVIITSVVSI